MSLAVFVNNQHGIQRRRQDFDKTFVFVRGKYTAKRLTDKFPEKAGMTKRGVNKLLKKLRDTGTVDRPTKRYHTTTGSFQSHPHFIQKITMPSYA